MPKKLEITFDMAKNLANEKFNGKYSYDKFSFKNMTTKSTITCPKHGDFEMNLRNHAILGQECPKCKGRNLTTDDIKHMFEEKHHGKYNYDKVTYIKMHSKVTITCPIHGDFIQTPSKHLIGRGCPKCKSEGTRNRLTLEEQVVIERMTSVHDGFYSYDKFAYNGMHSKSTITCPKHGDFEQIVEDHVNGRGCPICSYQISNSEREIFDYLTKIIGNDKVISRDRTILEGKEIDILVPSMRKGIEFNGIRWHSEEFGKGCDYHLNKKLLSLSKGFDLIEIDENVFNENKEMILNIIEKLVNDDINIELINNLRKMNIIESHDNRIILDRRYSTKALVEFIKNEYDSSIESYISPIKMIEEAKGKKYNIWNCGFIKFKRDFSF